MGPDTWAKLYAVTGSPAAPGGAKPVLKMDPLQVVGHVPKKDEAGRLDWEPFAIGGVVAAVGLGVWWGTR
jgi:hypothetical protein